MVERTTQERAKALFAYLKELSSLRQKSISNIYTYPWQLFIRDIAGDVDNIEIFYRDRTEDEDDSPNPVLLRVHKPEFKACPQPLKTITNWLLPGWDDFRQNAEVRAEIVISDAPEEKEVFDADPKRISEYEAWLLLRNDWQEKQVVIENTRNIFSNLYQAYIDLNREIETMEVVVANGFLLDNEDSQISHPLITRRVTINFNASENTITIEDLDVETELYTLILQGIKGLDLSVIPELNDELLKNDYHPLDRNDTPHYLKVLIHKLSSESFFSESGIPEHWQARNRFLMYCNPIFILRKRVDGTPRFLQTIIDNIELTDWVPSSISETVSGGKIEISEKDHESTIDEQLAAVGGEDVDILLSKEANREQLEIAQRIALYNAVLVQGPPGTGKTHTIANLMGHFLAQGKSVLVTSQTPKALQVLKEKLPENMKPLCVSVLNDSNMDMERSVDGITSFMSRYTSNELRKEFEVLKADRLQVIEELAAVRKKIYAVINTEGENIVLDGVGISPSMAAKFIVENEDNLSFIPGKVKLYEPLPLSYNELIDLYKSNETIDVTDENELDFRLPNPNELLDATEFSRLVEAHKRSTIQLQTITAQKDWNIRYDKANGTVINIGYGDFCIPVASKEALNKVRDYINSFGEMEGWMKYAAVDGLKGGAYAERWETLIYQIEQICIYSESVVAERFGKEMIIANMSVVTSLETTYQNLQELLERKGKVSKLDLLMNKAISKAQEAVVVNGEQISSADDCKLILHTIELCRLRDKCAAYWKELIGKNGSADFYELDPDEPERVAKEWVSVIRHNLSWYTAILDEVEEKISSVGIHTTDVFVANRSDTGLQKTEKIIDAIRSVVPDVILACMTCRDISEIEDTYDRMKSVLRLEQRVGSTVCCRLMEAVESCDVDLYKNEYKKLELLYDKYYLQKNRKECLAKIFPVAPDWANAIRNRDGIHGEPTLPTDIEDAWKWKQLSGIVSDIISTPYDRLQVESLSLSRKYRELTGAYAEKLAWYHLLKRTENDIDMRQALNGWKLTVRKIGKGTGKSAPKYKAQARELMAKCQNAVPAWIMPMNKVIESLDPRKNQFDVVIVDESSQSDVTALGVVYLAKKVIIVGDDRQVSPMAIGTEQDKMDALEKMFIKDIVPLSHLYGANTSLYDIAATTYQPLMLREHFRCVPEIIGFSNGLSYDYQIKPLRDAGSSKLLPAVVNYRVDGGERVGKHNSQEAKAIVALMKACIEQPEYAKKTFGVISLLGDEQARNINALIYSEIGPQEVERRSILCGNPSHFQGDERDVIFLSVVDSSDESGPLAKREFGAGEAYRKSYNVAVSRAKDQLWVVDSLDAVNDLKPGDIRKRLIEYSQNPNAFAERRKEIEAKSDSPFETSVASALMERGYNIVQQWPVGAYRLDMVVVSGNKHIAIECDGERFHSGEAKIREDMERQTILERAGWRFIRIRGSEYFRNPTATVERVLKELHLLGIEPELHIATDNDRGSSLLQRVKNAVPDILTSFDKDELPSLSTVREALRSDVYHRAVSNNKPIPTSEKASDSTTAQMSTCQVETKRKDRPLISERSDLVGCKVIHSKFGQGTVREISLSTIEIFFNEGLKTLAYPGVFTMGICTLVEPSTATLNRQ